MNNIKFVNVFYALNELSEKFAGLTLFESFFLYNLFKEFTLGNVFHDEEKLFGGFDNFVELDQAGVTDLFEDVDFAGDSLDVCYVDDFALF